MSDIADRNESPEKPEELQEPKAPPKPPQGQRNVGASIWERLRNRARAKGDDISLTLLRYVGERFLYRLSQSPHSDRFVLKGATLFTLWADKPHRATRDLDLLGAGDNSPEAIRAVIQEIAAMNHPNNPACPDDGVTFLLDTLRVTAQTEGRLYGGLHVEIEAAFATTRPRLEIDIAFGEAVTPAARQETLPTLLPEHPAPTLRVYPRETVIAEKCEAIVSLGIVNTRMKDFYDLWYMSRAFVFDGRILADAVTATFSRRETTIPADGVPFALTKEFTENPTKVKQWEGFLGKAASKDTPVSLPEVATALQAFLQPCLSAAASQEIFTLRWDGSAWHEVDNTQN